MNPDKQLAELLSPAEVVEFGALHESARSRDGQQRQVQRLPPQRECERSLSAGCADLARGADGWPSFTARVRTNPYLRARAYAAAKKAVDFAEFVRLMNLQLRALRHVRDYTCAGFVEHGPDGRTVVRRVLPVRRNAKRAAIWLPVIDFLLIRNVRPAQAARLVATLANVEACTVRGWLTDR